MPSSGPSAVQQRDRPSRPPARDRPPRPDGGAAAAQTDRCAIRTSSRRSAPRPAPRAGLRRGRRSARQNADDLPAHHGLAAVVNPDLVALVVGARLPGGTRAGIGPACTTFVTRPETGTRFTCTSIGERKMLICRHCPGGAASGTASPATTTRPSAGETTSTGPRQTSAGRDPGKSREKMLRARAAARPRAAVPARRRGSPAQPLQYERPPGRVDSHPAVLYPCGPQGPARGTGPVLSASLAAR